MQWFEVKMGSNGFFAVLMTNEDGFPESVQRSPITCNTFEEAQDDAKAWAEAEADELEEGIAENFRL